MPEHAFSTIRGSLIQVAVLKWNESEPDKLHKVGVGQKRLFMIMTIACLRGAGHTEQSLY